MLRKYFIKTYGCQMNKYDSFKLAEVLEKAGFSEESRLHEADIILVNTCCVREHAEKRAFGFISSLKSLKNKRPNLIIGVCGCIPKQEHVDIKAKFPFVDLVFGPNEPEKLKEYLITKLTCFPGDQLSPFIHLTSLRKNRQVGKGVSQPTGKQVNWQTSYITIMHGCDNFCSYCIVPYVRGREYSRPIDEVLAEVRVLIEQGAKDITLLGQNVNSYKYGLANLLREIGNSFHCSLPTFHFMTSHPKDMSDEIIETVYKLPYVAKEFHLPVQSGDDEILQKMNRGYTVEYYRKLIARIRSLMPEARITTDIIVGFPGETEEQFQNTLNLVKEIRFNAVNMAAYSVRAQTAAAKMSGHLPERVKQDRLQRLIRVVREVVGKN